MNIRKDSLRLVRWAPPPRPTPGVPYVWERVVPGPPTRVQNQAWNPELPRLRMGRGHQVQPGALQPVTQSLSWPLCPRAVGQVWAQSWLSQLGLVGGGPAGPLASRNRGCCSAPHSSQDTPTALGSAARISGGLETASNLGDQRRLGRPQTTRMHQLPFLGQEAREGGPCDAGPRRPNPAWPPRSLKGGRSQAPASGAPGEGESCPLQGGDAPEAWPLTCPVPLRPPQV